MQLTTHTANRAGLAPAAHGVNAMFMVLFGAAALLFRFAARHRPAGGSADAPTPHPDAT